MRYVILRDDDTSGITPIECLEYLYRPFFEKSLPVSLAVIPNVNTRAKLPDNTSEYFLIDKSFNEPNIAIGSNKLLIKYLKENVGYEIVQHGYQHDFEEFLSNDTEEIITKLEKGKKYLLEAGFTSPTTFVAPHDKLSKNAIEEAAKRYPIISTGWFERKKIPFTWWPKYLIKKLKKKDHWKIGNSLLLSRPGSFLSRIYPPDIILENLKEMIFSRTLTVISTHWWEFYDNGKPNKPLIKVLHSLADYLAGHRDIKVITFRNLLEKKIESEVLKN